MSTVVTTQTFAAVGDCCCPSGACKVCGFTLPVPLSITITAATGRMAVVWFNGVTGYTAIPITWTNPFSDLSVEVCGGLLSVISLHAYCMSNNICFGVQLNLNRDVTCTVETTQHIGNSCDPGMDVDCTVTLDTVLCDVSGFVSVSFLVDCGADGTFSGTIHR